MRRADWSVGGMEGTTEVGEEARRVGGDEGGGGGGEEGGGEAGGGGGGEEGGGGAGGGEEVRRVEVGAERSSFQMRMSFSASCSRRFLKST